MVLECPLLHRQPETQVRVHLLLHVVVHLFKKGDGPSDEFISSGIFLSYFCTHCEVRVGEMTLISCSYVPRDE